MGRDDGEREQLTLEATDERAQTGLLIAVLEEGRQRTLRELATLSDPMLTWVPPAPLPAIGQLLYHVPLIEADWLLNDILQLAEHDWPAWLMEAFPIDVRDDAGRLSTVPAESLETALARMQRVRTLLLTELRTMTDDDLHVPRARANHDVTPAWALHHLAQHEAEHRSQIAMARELYLAAHV